MHAVRMYNPPMYQKQFTITTKGRGSIDITAEIQGIVSNANIESGLCHVFVHHTSASLMICENADPTVRSDMERFMAQLVPDGDPMFEHVDEGPDDMPAHVRTILTQSSLTIPVSSSRADLGIWQGVYLWEHRAQSHTRRITVSVQ